MSLYKNFENYIWGAIGLSGNIARYVRDMGDKLMELRKDPNYTEIVEIKPNKFEMGHFYLISYSFNGNYIWCPILALDYKVHKNKHILYAINLEYLPPRWKIMFFNKLFKQTYKKMELAEEKKLVKVEPPLKFLTFEKMYKFLEKNGRMTWAITAYTIKDFDGKLKVKKCYLCSLKILPEVIMCDLKRHNRANMMKLQKSLVGAESVKMSKILEEYDEIIETYQEDSIDYHKRLSLFREKLKLFKD